MSKVILANMGFLFQIAGSLTVLPILIGLFFNETRTFGPLFLACGSFLIIGFLMNALCERKDLDFKSSCTLILLSFVLMPLIGAIPYCYDNPFNSTNVVDVFTNAYFESVSGFTTTGFSFFIDSSTLPRSFIMYRAVTELIGGVGIVFILLVFFQSRKAIESWGSVIGIERINDKLKKNFFSIFLVYGLYIVVFTLLFYLFGIRDLIRSSSFVIDAITGGYSPSPSRLLDFLVFPMNIFVLMLMFLGSVHFGFHYHIFTLKLRKAFTEETILYLTIIVASTIIIFLLSGIGLFDSLFHVVSMTSSTGFDYINISKLDDSIKSIFILLTIIGGCAFSMAGGIKISRIITFTNSIKPTVRAILLKEGVMQEEQKDPGQDNLEYMSALVSITLFLATLFVFSILFSTIGISFTNALFEVASALTTNGFSTGATTLTMPLGYKWLLIIAMIIGRIEIIPILVAVSSYLEKLTNKNVMTTFSRIMKKKQESPLPETPSTMNKIQKIKETD